MKECAFDKCDKCDALVEKQCKGCSFYKTTDELFAGRKKAKKRISTLPLTSQIYIKRKYYSTGKTPSNA